MSELKIGETRTCPTCLQVLPLTKFEDSRRRDGFQPLCWTCTLKQRKLFAEQETENPSTRTCRTCLQVLPPTLFRKDSRRKDKRQPYCKSCQSTRGKEYVNANPEKIRASQRTPKQRFTMMRNIAARDGRTFSLTREQYDALILQPCTYCGFPLDSTGRGLDRIDNSKGYDMGNVNPCCGPCNRARSDFFTIDEMHEIIGPAIARIKQARLNKARLTKLS